MRELYLRVKIDWDDYDDVVDELVLEDSGILDELKTGVTVEPLSSHAVLGEVANGIGDEVIKWADEISLVAGYDEDLDNLIKRLEKYVRNYA